jgi:hypothetical protein
MIVESWQENLSPRSFKWVVKNFELLPIAQKSFILPIADIDELCEIASQCDAEEAILLHLLNKKSGQYILTTDMNGDDEYRFSVRQIRKDDYIELDILTHPLLREYIKE